MYFISRYSWLTDIGVRLSAWQRWLVTLTLIISMVALWYITAFNSLKTQLARNAQQQQHLADQRAVYAALAQRVDQLDTAVAAAKTNWLAAVHKEQQGAGYHTLFSLLDMFGTHGVNVQAYYPQQDAACSWYIKQSAQLHVSGTFDQLMTAFTALNTNEKILYNWQQVRLERRDDTLYCTATVSSKIPKGGEYV